jgi:eukaryotic-like serine/threonine-protein kinase
MDRSLSAGETVAHYRILSLLGKGGMGQVYLAEDTKLDRHVALKVLPPEVAADTDRMRRFVTEAKSASAVRHANVAHIYDVGQENGIHFIAMEFIEGETLADRLQKTEPPLSFVLETATQIADALDEAHSTGIVHRDLKPANLMMTRREQVKILDFGLARVQHTPTSEQNTQLSTHSYTTPGVVMGTVPYMSPEQVLGKTVDHRSDLFSFGVILYQMLTRRLPFSGNSSPELMDSILHKTAEPLSRFNYDVPQELERIVRKCLEKNPEDRYQSAKDLLVDLRAVKRDTQSATIAKTKPVDQSRNRLRLILVAIILLIAAAVVFLFVIPKDNQVRSIAVLPFENISNDSDIEYLKEGIPESLINRLSQIPELMVIARTSSFAYKTNPVDIRKVGHELNVQSVLTGRILQHGDSLSLSVELVDAQTNRQIWGEKYNERLSDIMALQEDLAKTIVETLRVKLTGEQKQQLSKTYTQNSEAFKLYLQGRYHWNKATDEGNRKAIVLFNQAIEQDPSFALGYAGLADAYGLAMGDANIPPGEASRQALDAAQKAIQLDPSLVEPRTVEAVVAMYYEYDFKKSEEKFKQAIAMNPNYAIAHHQYAWHLTFRGRFDEAIAEYKKAQQLDPLSVFINIDLNVPYVCSGRYAEALAAAKKAKELDPNFWIVDFVYGFIYNIKEDYSLAIQSLQRAAELDHSPIILGMLGSAYARAGQRKQAEDLLAELQRISSKRYVSPYHLALIYTGLDRKKEAIAMLKKGYDEHDFWSLWLKIDQILKPLRSDPEYQELIRKIDFD